MATENAADESNLAAIKNLFEKVRGSFGRFIKPQSADIDALTEVLKDATNTNRMGSDEEFQKFVNEEMAIGIMSKLAGTASTDDVVSLILISKSCLTYPLSILVPGRGG